MIRSRFLIITLFIVISYIATILLSLEKNTKIEQHLNALTLEYTKDYNALYDDYLKLSNLIFDTKINTPEVLEIFKNAKDASIEDQKFIREKLYKKLLYDYNIFKKYNIKQLHFHLPNNVSFLRFHRPNKYGDDLTDIRSTIKYVNETKKFIDGFEEGRIYNGYRFVFPLFYQDEYLGSVETSFNTLAITLDLIKNYNVFANFLINKDVVEAKVFNDEQSNYKSTPFKHFLIEKEMMETIQKLYPQKTSLQYDPKSIEFIDKNSLTEESFSIFDPQIDLILTFIKIKNPVTHKVVGAILIKNSPQYINNKIMNYYIVLSVFITLLAIIMFFVHKRIESIKLIQEKNKELEQLNNSLEIKIHEAIEENSKKDALLHTQSKMAALGDMLGNIAHQWRQPLSIISTLATGMKIQKETNQLKDENLLDNLQIINDNTQYLSKTIDDFRHFIKGNNELNDFELNQTIHRVINIIHPILDKHYIQYDIQTQKEIKLYNYEDQLVQVLINILQNAKDALVESKEEEKFISIQIATQNDTVQIVILDNGGGIPAEIQNKIFEPYFTTKHKSQGTGLGLHMSYNIVNEALGGTISVENRTLIHKGKAYTGAAFIITLPLS